MRDIKFRGKRVDNGELVYGLLSIKDNRYYISNKAGMPFAFEVRPETVGQYTGLRDKNGVEIYEGDIVQARIHKKIKLTEDEEYYGSDGYKREEAIDIWTIEYKERFSQGVGFWCYGRDRRFNTRLTGSTIFNCGIEVIGNIHQQPELLKEE